MIFYSEKADLRRFDRNIRPRFSRKIAPNVSNCFENVEFMGSTEGFIQKRIKTSLLEAKINK